jgi:hypothetical protein
VLLLATATCSFGNVLGMCRVVCRRGVARPDRPTA